MRFFQEQAEKNKVQVIVTTHSPNLASVISLDNMVMIRNARSFSLARTRTKLAFSDYRFLERFLDVTKANLFFARGVMIVEGDAENILLPTLASLIGRDFTKHGVSIVNVGSVGLGRYARIFQRAEDTDDHWLNIPVACVTDLDVMPDCAPAIVGIQGEGDAWPELNPRKWRAKRDFDEIATSLTKHREDMVAEVSGQNVKTFVSDEWTLEYALALGPQGEDGSFAAGLAEDVFIAAYLAGRDKRINSGRIAINEVEEEAAKIFALMLSKVVSANGCTPEEVLASQVYIPFRNESVSKPIAAQYLAERLQSKKDDFSPEMWKTRLPRYLVEAIEYVTSTMNAAPAR
ncbi:MAG: hypothetical protein JW384_00083 [Nitrosomonadaceae bacterium]|nr:hypothetical protein [Nitrosomonadaceae bacterium]